MLMVYLSFCYSVPVSIMGKHSAVELPSQGTTIAFNKENVVYLFFTWPLCLPYLEFVNTSDIQGLTLGSLASAYKMRFQFQRY